MERAERGMWGVRPRGWLRAAAMASAVGCGQADLPGHYWELTFATAEDGCNSPAVSYSDELEYRIEIGVEEIQVAVGPDLFATGTVNGCTLTYDTVTWTEERPEGEVLWSLHGEATAQRGDGACGIASDWIGTETFTIVSSADPAINPGCTYTLDVSGTYLGEVE